MLKMDEILRVIGKFAILIKSIKKAAVGILNLHSFKQL